MRWFILAGLLSVALAGCRPPAGGAVDGLPPEVTADAQLSIPDLHKRIDQYRAAAATATARADALDRILSVKEQAALQTKARWAGAGFLALAVLLLVVSFYLGVARKTLLTAAVCLGLLGGGCLVFAWLVPYLLPIGIGLAVLLATTSRPRLIYGLYALAWPLTWFGFDRRAFAVRLGLTLDYVEHMPKPARWLDALRAPLSDEALPATYTLEAERWQSRDSAVILAGSLLLWVVLA